jgi:hypothetical protein
LGGLSGLGVVVLAYVFGAPYIEGKRCAREILVSPNVHVGFHQPLKPSVICSEKQMKEFLQRAKSKLGNFDPARDEYGLVAFERTVQDFDFSAECLILISVWRGYDYKVSLNTPFLESRKLNLQVAVRAPFRHFWTLPEEGSQLGCLGVAVRREFVDQVEIRVGEGQPELLLLD